MAQINLLKQNVAGRVLSQTLLSIGIKICLLALAGLFVFYGVLYYQVRNANTKTSSLEQNISNEKNTLSQMKGRDEVLTRQGQLKELDKLITQHIYWSNFLPALSKATLKTASFASFRSLNDGSLNLSVMVPSIQDLDKFLQVFNLPEFYKNFSDIKIGSIDKAQDGDKLSVKFDVNMKYNSEILKYQPAAEPAALPESQPAAGAVQTNNGLR